MLSYELREHVLDYINNKIDFEDLQDWYVPRLRQFLEDPNSADADVVAVIEHASVHLAEGLSSDDEVKDMLWDAVSEHGEPMYVNWPKPSAQPSDMRVKVSASASSSNERHVRSIALKKPVISYS